MKKRVIYSVVLIIFMTFLYVNSQGGKVATKSQIVKSDQSPKENGRETVSSRRDYQDNKEISIEDISIVTDTKYTFSIGGYYDSDYFNEEGFVSNNNSYHYIYQYTVNDSVLLWQNALYDDIGIFYTMFNPLINDFSQSEYYIGKIILDTPRFSTQRGIHVGSTIAELFDAYGDNIDLVSVPAYDADDDDEGISYYSIIAYGIEVDFQFSGDKITEIILSYYNYAPEGINFFTNEAMNVIDVERAVLNDGKKYMSNSADDVNREEKISSNHCNEEVNSINKSESYKNDDKNPTSLHYEDIASVMDSEHSICIGADYNADMFDEKKSNSYKGEFEYKYDYRVNGCDIDWKGVFFDDIDIFYTSFNPISEDFSGTKQYIGKIALNTRRFSTGRGIRIGDNVDDIKTAYGRIPDCVNIATTDQHYKDMDFLQPEEYYSYIYGANECYCFIDDGVELDFYVKDNIIRGITLSYFHYYPEGIYYVP